MKEKIKYQEWPERVKILTALSNKKLLIKNYKIPRTLGYFVLIMGIIDLIYRITQNSVSVFLDILYPLSFVLIGLANLVSANVIKWIAINSSWEERFENTSTTAHKFIYLFLTAILLTCLYPIFMLD